MSDEPPGIAALILAAGRGTRFGESPKLLADLRGKPVVRWVAQAAIASVARPVVVVTGHKAPEVERALSDLPIQLARNPDYAEGLSTSLKAGFRGLPPGAEAAVVLLGDMPLVTTAIIDRLAQAWHERGKPSALVPVTAGRRSNPVVLARTLESEVLALEGDAGAGLLLRRRADVVELALEDAALLADVDTAGALASLNR